MPMSEEQKKELRAFFDSVDENKDGVCTWEEAVKFMRNAGWAAEEGSEEWERQKKDFLGPDADGGNNDGKVTFDEVVAYMEKQE